MATPGLSFFGAQISAGATGSTASTGPASVAPKTDNSEELVKNLLSRLSTAPASPPPTVGAGRQIAGGLGDALSAMAAVRAGGAPPSIGRFAATTEGRQRDFERKQEAAAQRDRDIQNRLIIGEFEDNRRIRIGREEADRRADKKVEADKVKRGLDTEANYRQQLRDKIIDLGIDTGGTNLLEASIDQLQEFVASHDPEEVLRLTLENIPDDRILGTITRHPNGTVSITTKTRDAGDNSPTPAQLLQLAQDGTDVSSLTRDKTLAKIIQETAAKASGQFRKDEAEAYYRGALRFVTESGTSVIDDTVFATVPDMQRLLEGNATPKDIHAYYKEEIGEVAGMLEEGKISPEEAQEIASILKENLRVGFPEVDLPSVEFPAVPSPALPASSPKKPGRTGGIGKFQHVKFPGEIVTDEHGTRKLIPSGDFGPGSKDRRKSSRRKTSPIGL